MCGIHATVSPAPSPTLSKELKDHLCSRGPDHVGTVQATVDTASGPFELAFTSTVLALRGDHIAKQPLRDEQTGSVLCWNGEAWRIHGEPLAGNDTEAVLALLTGASRSRQEADFACDGPDLVSDALRAIEGPFAFIYFDKPARRLYYGRDRLGRRSLLVKAGSPYVLSSIAESTSPEWVEVEADGFYSIQLNQVTSLAEVEPTRHVWADDESLISNIGHFNMEVPDGSPSPLGQDSPAVSQLQEHLVKSLETRVSGIPRPPAAGEKDARLAVLFSGGLDCTVLARLASGIVPSDQVIDLLNVAFENPRIASQNPGCSQNELYELCPDRITGRKSFAELVQTCPARVWRLVTVNVPYEETTAQRSEVIRLIHPHSTEMDLSIANALYFAARGHGYSVSSSDPVPRQYQTTARVLLSGLGADELFGGYSRHGGAFAHGGYSRLVDELKLDVSRLGKRNLGRDDRVMAQWGREVRFPFLDEKVVEWTMDLPAWEKCDFGSASTANHLDPEKRVLRFLAQNLGLISVAGEKKRAIQFGARTAKMESGKVKGTTSIAP